MKKVFILGVLASVGAVSVCFGMQRDGGVQQALEDKSETVVVQLSDQKAEEAFSREFVEKDIVPALKPLDQATFLKAVAQLGVDSELGNFDEC